MNETSLKSFWYSMDILINKPHIVNKRLWGSKILCSERCEGMQSNWLTPLTCKRLNNEEVPKNFLLILESLNLKLCSDPNVQNDVVEVLLLELLPRCYEAGHAFQLVCTHKESSSVAFYDVSDQNIIHDLCPDFAYILQYIDNNIIIRTESDKNTKSYKWLLNNVLPQCQKWASEFSKQNNSICNQSLALVSVDKYYHKYNELKDKYGKNLVQIWPECTDPSKFVYEDIAIATYLLLLWDDENLNLNCEKWKRFVDLGCGNGLLVYILTMEGHHGIGVDVRKRQIWDMYPKNIILEEKTIVPSDTHLFPDAHWLIGNHSDELTPWLPVVAAQSSYACNFFLLPCCAYNFDGSKYQRRNSSKSQYSEYIDYIKELCEECGFITDIDRLKIPSTKRICIIGRGRTYTEENYPYICRSIKELIKSDATLDTTHTKSDIPLWINNFKPRQQTEKVRNCTQINKKIMNSLIQKISNYLLEDKNFQSFKWCCGRTASLNELAQIMTKDELMELKSECGGLQTLLKNNHNIFNVQSGKVQLRYPRTAEEIILHKNKNGSTKLKIRQKPCWFFNNHPQGCPLLEETCSYLHIKEENIM